MDEFDPAAELGLVHDKQFVCSSTGFLQLNNSSRDLCERFIDHGDKLYDLISRYDYVVSYILNRPDIRSGNVTRYISPFLKAFGVTDFGAMDHCRKKLNPMPEAKRVMKHLMDTLPTFVSTSSFEHNVIGLCSELDIPSVIVDRSDVSFDDFNMDKQEARSIREIANSFTSLRMPGQKYELDAMVELDRDEIDLVVALDKVFCDQYRDLFTSGTIKQFRSVGADSKAHFLLDLRQRTSIDFDGTAYVGGDMTDILALDSIKNRGGLALSFNGCDFAVRNSNIAVMSRDCTVAAVLVQEFYNEGIEAVFDLVESWDRKTLEKKDFPDPYLMRTMLGSNPKKLPEVYIVKKDNADEIAKKSEKFRKNFFKEGRVVL